jgi:hypothetical protein
MALALVVAGSATALTINTAIVANGSNTADVTEDTLTAYSQYLSTRTILDGGGTVADVTSNMVDARTRYAAVTGADSGAFTNRTRNATANYKVTFTITAPAFVVYDLVVDTSRLGALTTVNEVGANQASASVSAVTGLLGGVGNANLGLVSAATGGSGGDQNVVLNQSNTLTLTGLTGNQTIVLDFSWTSTADSTCSGFACNTAGTDEAAVRLGLAGTTSGSSAEDYPGVGGRVAANDGHFVNAKATITFVPEPGTSLLLMSGIAGLAAAGRKRA